MSRESQETTPERDPFAEVESLKARAAVFRSTAVKRFTSPDDLDDLMMVTKPQSWLLLAGLFLVLAAAGVWAVFGQVAMTVAGSGSVDHVSAVAEVMESGDGESLSAVLWVPIAEAQDIRPGMEARLEPRGFPVARFGFLQGRARAVDPVPTTLAELRDDEPALFGAAEGDGVFVRVIVDLMGDEGGLSWSVDHERAVHLVPGVPVDGRIFTGSEQPLGHFLPWPARTRP